MSPTHPITIEADSILRLLHFMHTFTSQQPQHQAEQIGGVEHDENAMPSMLQDSAKARLMFCNTNSDTTAFGNAWIAPNISQQNCHLLARLTNSLSPSIDVLASVPDDMLFWPAPSPSPSPPIAPLMHSSLYSPTSLDVAESQSSSDTSSTADANCAAEGDGATTLATTLDIQTTLELFSNILQHPDGQAWLKQMRNIVIQKANPSMLRAKKCRPTKTTTATAPFEHTSSDTAKHNICGRNLDYAVPSPLSIQPVPPSLPLAPVSMQELFQVCHPALHFGSDHDEASESTAAVAAGASSSSTSILDHFIADIAASIDQQESAGSRAQRYLVHCHDDSVNTDASSTATPARQTVTIIDDKQSKRPDASRTRSRKRVRAAQVSDKGNDEEGPLPPIGKDQCRATRCNAIAATALTEAQLMSSPLLSPSPSPPQPQSPQSKPTDAALQQRLMDRRKRRRESHNVVERRRRELINTRIAEMATLLPEAMLIECIAYSTGGGTASMIDLVPFLRRNARRQRAEASATAASYSDKAQRATSSNTAGSDADGDDDDNVASLFDAIAKSKPNKGIILTKSIDYIKQLHEVCAVMRATNVELHSQLQSVRHALLGGGDDGGGDSGAKNQHHRTDTIASPKNKCGRVSVPTSVPSCSPSAVASS